MGKNARLRREREKQLEIEEQRAVQARRRLKYAPLRKLIIKSVATVVMTVLIFYVGRLVNDRLPTIVSQIRGGQ